jgi:hypothetical protein
VFPLLLAGALVSLALRYRRGDQRLRQQMKWLGLAIAAVLATQAVGGLAIPLGQANKPLQQVPYAITPFLVLSPSRWPWRSRSCGAGCSTST